MGLTRGQERCRVMESTPKPTLLPQLAPKEPKPQAPIQAQLNQARKMGKKRKMGQVQPPCKGAGIAIILATPQCPLYDRLGTHPDRDGFTVVNTKRGKKAKKTCKPTPQEEEEEADRVLLEREPKSEKLGE